MYCSECGTALSEDAHFCPQCGHEIVKGASPQSSPASQSPPKKKMALWKKVVIGLIAIIVVSVSLALFLTSGLTGPVERQLAALGRGDIDAAYDVTSQAFQRSTSKAQFEQFVRAYPIITDIADHSFSERRVENGIGYLSGTLTSESGGVQPVSYRLVKENGEWKILGIDLNPGE